MSLEEQFCRACQNADKRQSLFILISHFKLRSRKKTSNLVLTLLPQWLNGNSKRQIEAPELGVRDLCHVINLMLAPEGSVSFWRSELWHTPSIPSQRAADWPSIQMPPWREKKDALERISYEGQDALHTGSFERSTLPWRIFMNLKKVYLCRSQQ